MIELNVVKLKKNLGPSIKYCETNPIFMENRIYKKRKRIDFIIEPKIFWIPSEYRTNDKSYATYDASF